MTVIASLNAEIQMYETNHKRLQDQYQLLQDEHQALQLTATTLDEKLRKTQVIFVHSSNYLDFFSFLNYEKYLLDRVVWFSNQF